MTPPASDPNRDGGPDAGNGPRSPEPGTALSDDFTQPDSLKQALAQFEEDREISRADFDARYAVSFDDALGYEPMAAAHMDLIQASMLGLDADEQSALEAQGFAIQGDSLSPTFAYAYQTIYALDLPVYITLDSLLDVMHVHYDYGLLALEREQLRPALEELLSGMRSGLAGVESPSTAELDADVYLSVASGLLAGVAESPAFEGNAEQVRDLLAGAQAGQGAADVSLFGSDRRMDFSQFVPRGHYADEFKMQTYFRAMMWLGRIDLRLIEPENGQMVFRRRQFELMAVLARLLEPARDIHRRIDDVLATFVGEPDYMTPDGAARLASELGAGSLVDAARELDDAALVQALHDGGHGLQRISSHVLAGEWKPGETTPLPVSFALLGQRYVVDSEVFSNVVWDRVRSKRMMPDPLDAAFAALGNDQAAALLADQLYTHAYHGDLHAVRASIEAEGEDFWQLNLYNRWLSALRAVSPPAEPSGLPAPLDSDAWGRRLLVTQLGSWAQLRHDTILYAKQSYTGGAVCEFPDAYVDPYPEAIEAIHDMLAELLRATEEAGASVSTYASGRLAVLKRLSEIARYERAGEALREDDLAWINRMIDATPGCAGPGFTGWYAQELGGSQSLDPTIADVHTQPTDEVGNEVGRVLHVGTGMVHHMVVSLDTPQGPRAFVAPVYGYREMVTEDYDRWDDARWTAALVGSGAGSSPAWAPVTGGGAEGTQSLPLTYCDSPL